MSLKSIKLVSNIVVLGLFIFSIIMLFKYSNIQNYFNLQFMKKPKNVSNIALSIYTSLFVTVIFYIIIELIPEIIKQSEKEDKQLPFRSSSYRSVQTFTIILIGSWCGIINYTSNSLNINTQSTDINKIFDEDVLKKLFSYIKLSDSSDVINIDNTYINWYTRILMDLEKIDNIGKEILHYYKMDIPGEIYEAIYYLLNYFPLQRPLKTLLPIVYLSNGSNAKLGSCIPTNIDLEESRKRLNLLLNWCNSEYIYLTKKGIEISSIEIPITKIPN